jgi:hypothetical protein
MNRVLRCALLALVACALFRPALGQVVIRVGFAPPALPIYDQPPCPEDGWMWVPGYWGWDDGDEDYYWVPGSWVEAPQRGLLWTPAWWGWEDGAYLFHDGFWAPEVGWYGGINYGYGYFGHGFYGGRWDRDRFYYNTAVVHVNETVIRNVYVDRTVINNTTIVNNHVSYNGGEGGIQARPRPEEERVSQGRHFPPVQAQTERRQMARSNPQMRASANQGRPPIAATARPTELRGNGVVAAREAGAPYHPPANRGNNRPGGNQPGISNGRAPNEPMRNQPPNQPYGHARDVPSHPAAPPPDNSEERRYQQQQQKMMEKQNQEHQKMQQRQEKEDQRAQQRQWDEQRKQEMEQRHQQQTQQMEQRHQQQQERVQPRPQQQEREQPRQAPPPPPPAEHPGGRPPH